MDRMTAELRLNGARVGSYLIRESERKPGSYVLSYFGIKGFQHFRLVLHFLQSFALITCTLYSTCTSEKHLSSAAVSFVSWSVEKYGVLVLSAVGNVTQ